jgi:hypothetical protein
LAIDKIGPATLLEGSGTAMLNAFMKTSLPLTIGLAAVVLGTEFDSRGQGTFVNLNFEQAAIPPGSLNFVTASSGMPGWTIYNNIAGNGQILYDTYTLGSPAVGIHDGRYPQNGALVPLQGTYSAFLQPNNSPYPGLGGAIGQVGTVPSAAHSLRFYAVGVDPALLVSFGGHSLSLMPIGSGPNYTIYGADISPYAGQTGELLFQAVNPVGRLGLGTELDNIFFSATPVPEPSVIALFALGALILGGALRRRNR